jgi:hypothetical protein
VRRGGLLDRAQTVARGEQDGLLVGGRLLDARGTTAHERQRTPARLARVERARNTVVTVQRPRDGARREHLAEDATAGEELDLTDGGAVERVDHADAEVAVALHADGDDAVLDGHVDGKLADDGGGELSETLQICARDARLCAGVRAHELLVDQTVEEELLEPRATGTLRGVRGPLDLFTGDQVLANEEFFEL